MKIVTGFGANCTWTIQTFPKPAYSRELMASMNPEFTIPQRACGLNCLNALQVRGEPPKTRHVDLMAIKVGWCFVSSMVGIIQELVQ